MGKFILPTTAGVTAIGLKTGLIIPNDDIADITAGAVEQFVQDRDIICVTEAVVARSQNRYISCSELAEDIQKKLKLKKGSTIAVISPIASRNRFALVLKSIAMATRGGKIILQLSIPFDEVGNQVIDEEFATTRIRLKKVLKSLREARENTPQLNVLIREIIAALKLQEIGYSIISIRKITGTGIADLTVRTPEGKLAVIEVSFSDLEKAAKKAIGIKMDVPNAQQALAITVNLGHHKMTIVNADDYINKKDAAKPQIYDFESQLDSYYDPDVVYTNELENLTFQHPITGLDYRNLYMNMITSGGADGEIIFTNNPLKVYDSGYIDCVCIGAVHEREKLRELFSAFGAMVPVVTIQDLGPGPWGVIGSNVSDFEKGVLKLLPGDADETAEGIKSRIKEVTGKNVEVLIFGDGAYKDPDTGIYELADPYPAIGVSKGLRNAALRTGTKLKLQVDTLYNKGYSRKQIEEILHNKQDTITSESLGTTPRSVTSIVATLADLVTGSADAGTPIVLVRGFTYSQGKCNA
ncbi:MAG: coenzyme F420-0:L-glutamate ligase [Tepidanaerobacteraceae bacterium]|jgi:F420-0:gamma-glutamyl ligase